MCSIPNESLKEPLNTYPPKPSKIQESIHYQQDTAQPKKVSA